MSGVVQVLVSLMELQRQQQVEVSTRQEHHVVSWVFEGRKSKLVRRSTHAHAARTLLAPHPQLATIQPIIQHTFQGIVPNIARAKLYLETALQCAMPLPLACATPRGKQAERMHPPPWRNPAPTGISNPRVRAEPFRTLGTKSPRAHGLIGRCRAKSRVRLLLEARHADPFRTAHVFPSAPSGSLPHFSAKSPQLRSS